MKAAAEALLLFDTAKAVSELDKVKARWLTAEQRAELAELRNQADHAAAERMELENRTAAVLREHGPPIAETPTGGARRRGRRMRTGGCLGSLAIALAVLTLTMIALAR